MIPVCGYDLVGLGIVYLSSVARAFENQLAQFHF